MNDEIAERVLNEETESIDEWWPSDRQIKWAGCVVNFLMTFLIIIALLALPLRLLGFYPHLSVYYAIGAGCMGLAAVGEIAYYREMLIPSRYEQPAERVSKVLYWVGIVLIISGLVLSAF